MAILDTALMAHLMRRAGFGAPYQELEARAARDTGNGRATASRGAA